MGKYGKIESIVMDCDGLLWEKDSKEALAKQMLHDRVKSRARLYFWGIPTYFALGRVEHYDARGDGEKADAWCERAFRYFDGIVSGIDPGYVKSFGRDYARNIGEEERGVVKALHDGGYKLVLISGGIQELTEAALEEASVKKYFDKIICNRLIIRGGKVQGMEKRTSTPQKKAEILREVVDLRKTAAIGHDYWDRDVLSAAKLPICCTAGSWSNNSARGVVKRRKGVFIGHLSDVLEIFGI